MSKILHHNDDDGRCAAYIIKTFINTMNPLEVFNPKDFIEYNYSGNLEKKYPELRENETVYIVDISMCEEVLAFVKYCNENGCKVVHIDHHATGIKYFIEHKDELDSHMYISFMRNGISGSMLTWIYSEILSPEDRDDPGNALFEFDDDNLRNRCCLVNSGGIPVDKEGNVIKSERSITAVPDVLRFIDDNDIWKHKIAETMPFTWGFKLVENKHPLSQVWVDLFDVSDMKSQADFLYNIINNGTIVLNYKRITDAKNLSSGFYANVNGVDVCFLNVIDGNSTIFQEMYDHSAVVCKFNFDGTKWWYTMYSDEKTGADCSALLQYLADKFGESHGIISHGGHIHAGGCTFRKNIIDELVIDKTAFIEKRKQIRIDKMVAAEEARIAAAEEELRKEKEKQARLRAKYSAQMAEAEEEDYGF